MVVRLAVPVLLAEPQHVLPPVRRPEAGHVVVARPGVDGEPWKSNVRTEVSAPSVGVDAVDEVDPHDRVVLAGCDDVGDRAACRPARRAPG